MLSISCFRPWGGGFFDCNRRCESAVQSVGSQVAFGVVWLEHGTLLGFEPAKLASLLPHGLVIQDDRPQAFSTSLCLFLRVSSPSSPPPPPTHYAVVNASRCPPRPVRFWLALSILYRVLVCLELLCLLEWVSRCQNEEHLTGVWGGFCRFLHVFRGGLTCFLDGKLIGFYKGI